MSDNYMETSTLLKFDTSCSTYMVTAPLLTVLATSY